MICYSAASPPTNLKTLQLELENVLAEVQQISVPARAEAIMLQNLPIMLFGNSIKFTLLCFVVSHYALIMLHLYLSSIPLNHIWCRIYCNLSFTRKVDTFGALSLSRIVGVEVGFSSHSLMFDS